MVGGTGSISQTGVNTTINQTSQNMAIDWQGYNVNVDERVQYIQPDSSSISLNRILSQNGSTIAGRIDANGQVVLVNPNGIFFTPTSIINVGGIIASGLNIQPGDFMNGNYIFDEVLGTDGAVINSGMINASLGGNSQGGNVALIGKQVENDGLIVANLGSVTLAAGKQAVLTFDQGGLLGVRVSKEILQDELGVDPAVLNGGEITAEGGRVLLTASTSQDVFSQAVNTSGVEQATSVVVHEDGSFTLGAGADVTNTGSINTSISSNEYQRSYQPSSQNTGRIVLLGENVTSSGELRADAANGNGGEIELHAQNTALLTGNSLTSARSETEGQGGIVKVLGDRVGLFDQSTVDASGINGGGQALIGGDFRGNNTSIRNATTTIVNRGTTIYADAIEAGDGGKVILWSDDNTFFGGDIFTRGGELAGDGGLIETSGKNNLIFRGNTDRSAQQGEAGLLLLDPRDITIGSTGDDDSELNNDYTVNFNDSCNEEDCNSSDSDISISAETLKSELNNGDVLLEARRFIDVNSSITTDSSNTNNLTLVAGNDITITVNSAIDLGGGDLSLTAGDNGCGGLGCLGIGQRDITIAAALDTTGTISLNAADDIRIRAAIGDNLAPSSLTVRAGNDITVDATVNNGSITTNNGDVSLTAADATLVSDGITIAANGTPTGNIRIEGDIITGNGDFTATTTAGYFGNGFDNQNLNTGTGVAIIQAGGSGTFNIGGTDVTAGTFLGSITAGSLSVTTTSGQIIQSTDSAQSLTVIGTSSFNAGASLIDLQNTANNLQGAISLTTTGIDVGATLNDATTTTLDNVNISGDFTVNAGQDLTLVNSNGSNRIAVTGAAQLNFGQDNTGRVFTAESGVTYSADTSTLTGGTGNDTFELSANFSGTLNGAEGDDTFNIQVSGITFAGKLNGNEGADTFDIQGTENIFTVAIDGGADSDTLIAADETNYWRVNSANDGDIYSDSARTNANQRVDFSSIETLTGNNGIDDFLVGTSGSITNIDGGTGTNILTGRDANTTWTIANTGSSLAITGDNTVYVADFNNIDTLTGGAAIDTFDITTAYTGNINGGDNNDVFNIGADVSDTINGGQGEDIFKVTVATSGLLQGDSDNDTFNLSADVTSGASGGQGNDTFNILTTNTPLTGILNGDQGTDTLTAANETNYWTVSDTDQGTIYSDQNRTNPRVAFSAIETITGGTGTDDFLMTLSGSITNIDGGTGTNTLTGRDADSTWTIDGTNRLAITNGNIYVTAFTNITTLTGGTGNDTFTITSETGPGTFDGTLDGGGGSNTLTARDTDNAWEINTTESTLVYTDTDNNLVTSTFNAIQNITGGNLTDTFTVNAAINTINTGNGDNHVTVNTDGSITGTLTGGTGIDTIDIIGSAAAINTGDNNDLITVSGTVSGVIDGGNNSGGNDTLIINAAGDRIVQVGTAVLNAGENYTVNNIEIINADNTSGAVIGNTLRADAGNNIWLVNADNNGTVAGTGFTNFANLQGNRDNDSFTINAAINTINTGNGDNHITVNTDGSITGTLTGGTGVDTIDIIGSAAAINTGDNNDLITVSGTVSGVIDGGDNSGGNDTLLINATGDRIVQLGTAVLNAGENYTVNNIEIINADNTSGAVIGNTLRADEGNNTWLITTDNNGTVTGTRFTNFANLQGNRDNDSFTINAAINTINTGNGDNHVTVNTDGSITGTLTGGTGIDTIDIIGSAAAINTGDNNDLITVSGTVSGVIDGGDNSGGNDTLIINATGDRIVQLGTTVLNAGENYTVNNIEIINVDNTSGAVIGNTLRADEGNNTWLITTDNNGTVTGTRFTNFANLQGNKDNDSFTINAAINTVNAGNGDNRITVNGSITDLVGGTGIDTITVAGNADTINTGDNNDRITVSGTVTGVIDGGAGIDDRFMITSAGGQIVQLGSTDLNNGENYTAWNIETIDATGTTGNVAVGNTLRGDTGDNTWLIDGINSGSINNAASATTTFFHNFASLSGNTDTDAFTMSAPGGNLTGLMNGMGGDDSLNITIEGDMVVQLGNMVNENLNVFQIEAITANSEGINTLIGDSIPAPAESPVDYNWRIIGTDSGTVTWNNETTTFTNFNNLYAGTAVDQFTVTSTGVIDLIDMGAGNDFFTISGNADNVGKVNRVDGNAGDDTFTVAGGSVSNMNGGEGFDTVVDTSEVVNITVGEDIGDFEKITAQNDAGTINAQHDVQSDWLINGLNAGNVSVNGNTDQSLGFSGFSTINGGSGTDNFTVSGNGSIAGTVSGGGGDDTLLIDLSNDTPRTISGQINFDSGDGADMVTIVGMPNIYDETYNPNVNGYDQLSYVNDNNTNVTFDVNYRGTETVNDNIQITSLTINSEGNNIELGDNSFSITGDDAVAVNYLAGSKPDITVLAQDNNVNIASNVSIADNLTIAADTITRNTSSILIAGRLTLDNVNQTGTVENRLITDVNELAIINHSGSVAIEEQNDITLTGISNTSGSIDITTATGSVLSTADLITHGTLKLDAENNITLSGDNQLTGELTLSGSTITVNNTADTMLAGVTARNLTITSTGSITDAGTIVVQNDNMTGVTTLTSTEGGIILDNENNNFDLVELDAKTDVTLIESDGIILTNTTVGGALNVTSNNGLAANDVVIGDMRLGSISAATLNLNASEGAIVSQSSNLVADDTITLAAASGIGGSGAINTTTATLSIINASFDDQDTVSTGTTTGAVNINNTGNVIIDDLRNYGNIELTNSGDIILNVTSNSGAIDANYGGAINDPSYAGTVTIKGTGSNNFSTRGTDTLSGNADIIAETLTVNNVSRFGTQTSPIGLRVNGSFRLLASQSVVYYLGDKPDPIFTTGDFLELAIRGFVGISDQQLINIETLGEIDPAIFTEVRNYNHDDVAIRLPVGQGYSDDDDERENEGEESEQNAE